MVTKNKICDFALGYTKNKKCRPYGRAANQGIISESSTKIIYIFFLIPM